MLDFRRNLWLPGVATGVLLSVLLAVLCPATDMKPGDSRVLMGLVGMIFLVPGCTVTVYAARSAFCALRQFPRLRFVWMFMALTSSFGIAIKARYDWTESRRFLAEGKTTTGNVIETHPEDHDTLTVAYVVSDVDFRIRSQGPRVARSYRVGEPIQVCYYASAPAQGFCIEPKWRPDILILRWIIAGGVLPIWMLGVAGAFARRMRQG